MNGAHDLGGMHGLGPINAELDEPVFHHEWERRILALTLAAGAMGKWNIDISRHARENQPPAQYLANSYYRTWLVGLEKLLLQAGLISAGELASGRSTGALPDALAARVLKADQVEAVLSRGDQFRMADEVAAKFAVGESVRVLNNHPTHHTRAPRYTRGHCGVVQHDHGVFVFADANAQGNKLAQHIYSVCFPAQELWGDAANANDCVYVDLWDGHLEAVAG
ncbi:MAG: nitrile hydratase subunit beta [Alphaproteobacteria bacterium]|nr:nitrile hydratase subunit beta [Alphaproteobacteria bacterium]